MLPVGDVEDRILRLKHERAIYLLREKKVGLVLAGGGAKGAYQAGCLPSMLRTADPSNRHHDGISLRELFQRPHEAHGARLSAHGTIPYWAFRCLVLTRSLH
jgi:hypothetical protein